VRRSFFLRSKIKKSTEQEVTVSSIMLQRMSPLMALSDRYCAATECRLLGVERKSLAAHKRQSLIGLSFSVFLSRTHVFARSLRRAH
jgi:hypothetical protein